MAYTGVPCLLHKVWHIERSVTHNRKERIEACARQHHAWRSSTRVAPAPVEQGGQKAALAHALQLIRVRAHLCLHGYTANQHG